MNEANPDDFPAEQRAMDKRFFCRVAHASTLVQMLKGLLISSNCMVSFVINPDGLTLITEYQQCIQEKL